ncbi:MAG: arginase family protein [Actinomycetota bacterium]
MTRNGIEQPSLFTEERSTGDVAIIGIPAFETALSPTSAHETPNAIRNALARYSTYSSFHDVELSELKFSDLGDVSSPDHTNGEVKVANAIKDIRERFELLIALGGDNSITYSVANECGTQLPTLV